MARLIGNVATATATITRHTDTDALTRIVQTLGEELTLDVPAGTYFLRGGVVLDDQTWLDPQAVVTLNEQTLTTVHALATTTGVLLDGIVIADSPATLRIAVTDATSSRIASPLPGTYVRLSLT